MTRMARSAAVAALALAAAWAAPSPAASAPAGDPGAWVRLHDQRVLELRAPQGGVAPEQRARDATAALAGAVTGPAAPEPSVEVGPDGALLRVGGAAVLLLGPADTEAEGIPLEDLASRSAAQLRSALAAEARRRALHDLVYRWSMVVFTGLIAVLLARWLGRAAVAAADRLEAPGTRVPGLTLGGVEVLSGPAARGVGAVALRLGRFVAQAGVVLAWALSALARFEATRQPGRALLDALLGPTAALGRGLAGALPGLLAAAVALGLVVILLRGAGVFFEAVARGDAEVRWLPRELARPVGWLARAGLVVAALLAGAAAAGGEGLLAGLGRALVLALGLAAAPLLACALAGLPLAFGRAVRPGDRVEAAGRAGRVVEVGLLSLVLEDDAGAVVRLPHLLTLLAPIQVRPRGAGEPGATGGTGGKAAR